MISFLLAGIVERFRRRGWIPSSRTCSGFAAPPSLEALEDRCLLSATTTVPALADIPPTVGLLNVLMTAQPKGNPSVIFLGDSINGDFAYGPGAAVWEAFLAPVGAADYAITGQTTQTLLYQFSRGQLNGIGPAVVVLDIGANNLLSGDTPQATAAGILADVTVIHQYLPQAQVLVLGVLPGGANADDPYRIAGAQTDTLVSQMLAGDAHATFVDTSALFLQADGTISNSMLYDYIHPTTLGYFELTLALLPDIQQAVLTTVPSTVQVMSVFPA
ncbi:MAG TPA: GDSL-type esterase/lipase family protein [Gemmataceae bacterium]|nr:GDSL-type esterase/lipase family protein [Gemmataceae bacterium]